MLKDATGFKKVYIEAGKTAEKAPTAARQIFRLHKSGSYTGELPAAPIFRQGKKQRVGYSPLKKRVLAKRAEVIPAHKPRSIQAVREGVEDALNQRDQVK